MHMIFFFWQNRLVFGKCYHLIIFVSPNPNIYKPEQAKLGYICDASQGMMAEHRRGAGPGVWQRNHHSHSPTDIYGSHAADQAFFLVPLPVFPEALWSNARKNSWLFVLPYDPPKFLIFGLFRRKCAFLRKNHRVLFVKK